MGKIHFSQVGFFVQFCSTSDLVSENQDYYFLQTIKLYIQGQEYPSLPGEQMRTPWLY